MASPSRSISVARYTVSAFLASFLSSATTFSLPGRVAYSAFQSLSGSIPILLISWDLAFLARWTILSSGDSLRVIAACRARSLGSVVVRLAPVGKSRIWPTLDLTMKSSPRYRLMVLALAGDSTITKDLPIVGLDSLNSAPLSFKNDTIIS